MKNYDNEEHAFFSLMKSIYYKSHYGSFKTEKREIKESTSFDVHNAMNYLIRHGLINASHLKVLKKWGQVFIVPQETDSDYVLWKEAMALLEKELVKRKIL